MRVCTEQFKAGAKNNIKEGYFMDRFAYNILSRCKEVIREDWDMLFMVDGAEGSGKSVLAQQIAFFCDPTLTLDRIVFNPKDFKEAVKKAKKYQAIVYDEAYGGLSSRKAMSELNKSIVSMLTRIRKNNLFIIIVSPSYFDVDKYVAIWRSRFLFHVYSINFKRGYYKIYNYTRKKLMYMLGKPTYSYKIKSNFRCGFTNFYPLDEKEYRKKKDLCTPEEDEAEKKPTHVIKSELKKEIFKRMYSKIGEANITKTKLAQWVGIDRKTLGSYLNSGNEASDAT